MIVAFAGCKKNEEDENNKSLDDIFIVQVYSKEKAPEAVWDTSDYSYNANGKLLENDNFHISYNEDGTLQKVVYSNNQLSFFYDESKKIDLLIRIEDDEVDTIRLFYGSDSKLSYSTNSNNDTEIHYTFNSEGKITKKDAYINDFLMGSKSYTWVNGNMVRYESGTVVGEFQFDTKVNFFKVWHMPEEFLLTIQLELIMDIMALGENNCTYFEIKTGDISEYDETLTITEYNEAGLPVKMESESEFYEVLYEER